MMSKRSSWKWLTAAGVLLLAATLAGQRWLGLWLASRGAEMLVPTVCNVLLLLSLLLILIGVWLYVRREKMF